ncbi:MAG: DNA polymerase III subunit delta [Blastocatellia bacterium]|nr:MAG: DNA polymerase III subunit delta [Blastocatellia bacterium]
MPLTNAAAVRKQIRARQPDRIYLLQGDDPVETSALASEFADLVDEDLQAFNVERVHAGEMTTGDRLAAGVASVIGAARTLPMMSPWRVVIVAQADALLGPKRESEAASRAVDELEGYFRNPEAQTVLVFVSESLDKRSRGYKLIVKHATLVECGAIDDQADAERWVRTRVTAAGLQIEPAAARLLALRRGTEVKKLRGDVDRLLLYAWGQKTVTIDDARQVAGPAALQDDWAMTNAIEAGRSGEALRQLALLLDAGAVPEKILGQLGWLVRSKFPAYSASSLTTAVDALFRTDLDLKRSNGDPRILLERLVVELSAGKRARF